MKKHIFKVKYGYNTNDFVLVDNPNDLQRAIYAKANKIGVSLGGKIISGQEIKVIEPDVHSYTGWYRSYEPETADDFAQIDRDVPPQLYAILEGVSQHVNNLITSGKVDLIGRGESSFDTFLIGYEGTQKRLAGESNSRSMKDLLANRLSTPSPTL